jgi:hypothetical protein
MNIVRKIGSAMLVLGLAIGFTQAAEKLKPSGKPDATFGLSNKSVALGVGFSWGGGTLTYKGKEYPVRG